MPGVTDLLESHWSDVNPATGVQPKPTTFVPLEGACQYKFLLHTKGVFVCSHIHFLLPHTIPYQLINDINAIGLVLSVARIGSIFIAVEIFIGMW
jgi:hypothetical protein